MSSRVQKMNAASPTVSLLVLLDSRLFAARVKRSPQDAQVGATSDASRPYERYASSLAL